MATKSSDSDCMAWNNLLTLCIQETPTQNWDPIFIRGRSRGSLLEPPSLPFCMGKSIRMKRDKYHYYTGWPNFANNNCRFGSLDNWFVNTAWLLCNMTFPGSCLSSNNKCRQQDFFFFKSQISLLWWETSFMGVWVKNSFGLHPQQSHGCMINIVTIE